MDKDLNPLEGAPADRDRESTGTPPAPPVQPDSSVPPSDPVQPAGQTAPPTTWWQPRPGGARDAGGSSGAAATGAHSYPAAGAQGYPAPGSTGYTRGSTGYAPGSTGYAPGSTGYTPGAGTGHPTGTAAGYGQAWSNPYAATGGQSTPGQSPYGQYTQGQNPYAATNPAAGNPAAHGTATLQAPRPANRGRRTTMVVAGTVIFALAAGFGAGALGARVTSDSASGSASHTLTQLASVSTSKAAPADGSVEQVAATLLPSVVSVLSSSSSSAGEGSGVILTADGMILTNNHVISGATSLQVQFNDGTTAEATVVGADPTDDLAVIKATGVSGLTPATLGTSGDLQIGQPVIAVGSPLGLSATVTSGIVSALNRPVRTSSAEDQQQQQQQQQLPGQDQQSQTGTSQDTVMNAIQTDAAINPGNSGGPLVDMSGNVIGINSAIASLSSSSSSEGGSIGVGFAIPIDQAKRIAQEIIDTGTATHAVLGASVGDATQGDNSLLTVGAKVADVTAGSGAEKAGLKSGDVITKLGSQNVDSADALIAAVRSAAPNSQVDVTYTRGTQTNTITVTLGSASAN